jgi:lipid-binding SYLF domain-containing protein
MAHLNIIKSTQTRIISSLSALSKRAGLAAIFLALANCAAPSGGSGSEKRTDIHTMSRQTLSELYSSKPEARKLVANSAGYAVFNEINTKILTAGTSNGYGLATNRNTGKKTYMRMAGLSAGFGAGITNSRTIIIFRKQSTYNRFITSGWSMAADAEASAAIDRSGAGAGLSIDPAMDPIVYHMTRTGIALSATVGAEKVWPDKSLNL